jgi:hypothetical protein
VYKTENKDDFREIKTISYRRGGGGQKQRKSAGNAAFMRGTDTRREYKGTIKEKN